ncbi:MAG: CatB-related O-acetyltransferase [Verrucomicrobiales bacterium]|nr:CatB-related O-acetyltransferase [Nitrospinaceae bacterium]
MIGKIVHKLKTLFHSQDAGHPKDKGSDLAFESAQILGGNVEVGRWTYVGGNSNAFTTTPFDKITIGKFCSIADHVLILSGADHGHMEKVTTYPIKHLMLNVVPNPDTTSKGPVIIGNDVWIASHSIILSGLTIGDGSVIGAGAIVTKSIPPYSVVVGNPGRVIKNRFSDECIEKLLKIKWWDWDDETIINRSRDFYGDINLFVQKYYQS